MKKLQDGDLCYHTKEERWLQNITSALMVKHEDLSDGRIRDPGHNFDFILFFWLLNKNPHQTIVSDNPGIRSKQREQSVEQLRHQGNSHFQLSDF